MKKIILFITFISLSILSFNIFANPPAGVGNAKFGATTNSMPPGLQGKGTPYGLEKQNKTPYGWSQGKKTGWVGHHKLKKNHHRVISPKEDRLNH